MHIQPFVEDYLKKVEVMQLATAVNNRPWACTVHFMYDDDFRLYWISDADKRHSREIAQNPHVSVAMAIKVDQPVIGVQIEGEAVRIDNPSERERAARLFASRHGGGEEFIQVVTSGEKPMYCLTPRLISIFDKQNFPKQPKQEWRIAG